MDGKKRLTFHIYIRLCTLPFKLMFHLKGIFMYSVIIRGKYDLRPADLVSLTEAAMEKTQGEPFAQYARQNYLPEYR